MQLDQKFWDNKYNLKTTRWDIGFVSTPLARYIDQLEDKNISILVPGAGYGHEVEYLNKKGFKKVTVIDISSIPLQLLKNKLPDNSPFLLDQNDFFHLNGSYDLILEQTFFCALDPSLRDNYVNKCYELLNNGGKIVGVLFGVEFDREGPPFGGKIESYNTLFKQKFDIKVMSRCYNSIKPRENTEIFINLVKKKT